MQALLLTELKCIIYKRLAPGILSELQRVTPKMSSVRRRHHYFRRLTDDTDRPKSRELLAALTTVMTRSERDEEFIETLDRMRPQYG